MAANSATGKYARKAMYDGSAAYDLTRQGWYEPREEPEKKRQEPPAKPKAEPKAQAYGFSLFAAAGSVAAVVLLIFVLLAYVNYTDVTNGTVALEKRLEVLSEQERKLTIAYEDTFDINEIERYATTILGMSKPASGQTETLDLSTEDKAVVLANDTGDVSQAGVTFGTLVAFIASLTEYFR